MTELPTVADVPAERGPQRPLPPRPESREALFAAVRSAYGLPDDFRFSAAGTSEADASVAWALWDHLEDPSRSRPHLPGDPPTRPLAPELRPPASRRAAAALGRQVRALRDARGLTQRQLAEALGWDQPHVARLE